MDAMLGLVQPQLQQINRLLENGGVKNLKSVCLLGAYVKRRVNLALICDQKAVVPVDELAHCIRESLTYLTLYGAVCALHQEGKGSVDSREAQTAYDFFEDCLEAALPSLSALMVHVECGDRFSIRLMMEDAAGLPKADKYRALGKLTIDDADGAADRNDCQSVRLHERRAPPSPLCVCSLSGDRFAGFCSAGGIAFPPAGKRDPFPGSMDGSRIVPDGAQPFCVIYAVA